MRFVARLSILTAILMVAMSAVSFGQISVSITIAPPVLPIYAQPVCPSEGFIWTPGYWAYGDDGYFWVPGTWVEAPEVGFLWTPGYWGWNDGIYVWNDGYWGPQIGFYGGVDYGFGYVGTGYEGGYWQGGSFFYNQSVTNINTTVIHNVYTKTVVDTHNRVAFNGGKGGITARPTAEQETYAHQHHTEATATQRQHEQAARADRNQYASVNHGRPAVAATPKPGQFKGAGVVRTGGSAPERGAKPAPARESRTKSQSPWRA